MSLKNCAECNAQISKKAESCPKCGAKNRPLQIMPFLIFFIIAYGFYEYSEKAYPPGGRTAKYLVESSAGQAKVTLTNESGGTDERLVNTPWSLELPIVYGERLQISAQNPSNAGQITVRIFVNGDVVRRSSSEGAYSMSSVSFDCC